MYYDRIYTTAFIRQLREKYPEGTRIELVSLYDPCRATLTPGDQGTVTYIDGMGNFSVSWDNDTVCDLIYDDDLFRIID